MTADSDEARRRREYLFALGLLGFGKPNLVGDIPVASFEHVVTVLSLWRSGDSQQKDT